jgi:hypothetical protein
MIANVGGKGRTDKVDWKKKRLESERDRSFMQNSQRAQTKHLGALDKFELLIRRKIRQSRAC